MARGLWSDPEDLQSSSSSPLPPREEGEEEEEEEGGTAPAPGERSGGGGHWPAVSRQHIPGSQRQRYSGGGRHAAGEPATRH